MTPSASATTRSDDAQRSTIAVRFKDPLPREFGDLRRFEQLRVAQNGDDLWMRADDVDDDLRIAIASISGAEQFHFHADGQLTPLGARLPVLRLPRLDWRPIREVIGVELPQASYPGAITTRAVASLARCTSYAAPNVLMTTLTEFAEFALRAPEVRLRRWRLAVTGDGRTIIRGEPLPPIGGRFLVEHVGIAVEAGWTPLPPVDAKILAETLELAPGDLFLLLGDGSSERIAVDDFVPVSRSAVRATLEASGE